MKERLKYFPLTIISFLLLGKSLPIRAVEVPSPIDPSIENIGQIISKISGLITPISVLGFIFTVIYAGFVRMTAAGDPEKEKKGMKIAVGAAIGFAIMALAPLFVKVLARIMGLDPTLLIS